MAERAARAGWRIPRAPRSDPDGRGSERGRGQRRDGTPCTANTLRFSHQESVPVEGCDQRRWPGLQRVVRDFQRGPSEQAPAKRHSALGRLTALTCRDASLARPWTANPGEKTSLVEQLHVIGTLRVV